MKRLVPAVLALLVSGCGSMNPFGWLAPEEVTDPPAELVPISNQFQIHQLWAGTVGQGADEKSAKLVPQVDGERLFIASGDGIVMALNAITGKPLWRVQTGLEISGGPGVDGELVFVGTRDAELVALSSETGEEQWRAPVSSEILSVPKSALGVVVVHTVDGKLFGFDVLDGRQIWLYERPIPVLTLHGSSSPAVSGGRVLVGFASGKLVALDILNGTLLWETSVTLPSGRSELERMVDIDGDPLVMGGLVFVTTYQGQLAAVGEDNGSVFWRKDLSAYSDIRADWRGLYVSDAAGQVWAFDPGNGVALWKNKDLLNRGLSAPAVLGDYVVVGDFEGYLHWLSSVDGGLVARVRVGSEPILSPLVADDRLYVYGTGGDLAVFAVGDSQGGESTRYYFGTLDPIGGDETGITDTPDFGTRIQRDYDAESSGFDSTLPAGSRENY